MIAVVMDRRPELTRRRPRSVQADAVDLLYLPDYVKLANARTNRSSRAYRQLRTVQLPDAADLAREKRRPFPIL